MTSKIIFSSLLLLCCTGLKAQIEQDTLVPVQVDSAMFDDEPLPVPTMEEGDYEIAAPTYEGVEVDAMIPDVQAIENHFYFNSFKFKSLSTPLVAKPDKPAIYSGGIIAMNLEIQMNLHKPYMYGDAVKYVIIEVTVGADSMLYNPKVVYSSGKSYDNYATEAIEKLSKRFIPAKKGGKNVASVIRIPVRFERMENQY